MSEVKISIALPESFDVTRGKGDDARTVTVHIAKLHADIRDAIFLYGLKQKVADKAASATTPDEAEALMSACVESLYAGEWTMRGTGSAVDPMTAYRRKAVREFARVNESVKAAIAAAPAGEERDAVIDSIAERNAAIVDARAAELRDADDIARRTARDMARELSL